MTISMLSTADASNWKERFQERYGIAKDQVRKDVDDWLKSMP